MGLETNINWNIVGHAKQRALLERALNSNRLAHAYVFAGPDQVGKRSVARKLAQGMLCDQANACGNCISCKTFSAGSNPDYTEISADGAIKIESIRELAYKMSLKPYAGKFKICVIDDSHNLTVEAANSLLKILEEPKDHTIMLLVTDNPHKLLPTISSRAQKINFGQVEDAEFTEWLKQNNLSETDLTHTGRPGHAIAISQDSEAKEKNGLRLETFNKFTDSTLGEKLVLASELAEQETSELKKTFDYWMRYLQNSLRSDPTSQTVKKIKGLMRAQRLLDQNVNTKLLLSELMITSA